MSIDFNCPSCNAGLSVKEEFAGKNANCPQCGKPFTVPNASDKAPDKAPDNPLGGLNINTGESSPSPGGLNIDTGGGKPAAPSPGPAAPGPVTKSPVAQAPTKPVGQPAAPTGGAYASPGMDMTRDASSGEPPRRSYPALTLAVTIYTILSYLVLIVGALSMLGALGYGVVVIGGLAGVMVGLGACAVVVLYTFILWISMKAAAEFLKLAMNIEHDTHRMAEHVRRG